VGETGLVTPPVIGPIPGSLRVIKTGWAGGGPELNLGTKVVYTITVQNIGAAPDTHIMVLDEHPAGLKFLSALLQPPAGWNVLTVRPGYHAVYAGPLAVNEAVTVTLTYVAAHLGENAANTASVTSTNQISPTIAGPVCATLSDPECRVRLRRVYLPILHKR
jgi:uncharacterized repeat protein (TIGR01451 family)